MHYPCPPLALDSYPTKCRPSSLSQVLNESHKVLPIRFYLTLTEQAGHCSFNDSQLSVIIDCYYLLSGAAIPSANDAWESAGPYGWAWYVCRCDGRRGPGQSGAPPLFHACLLASAAAADVTAFSLTTCEAALGRC